jgi:diguanylate cyclase (GGDEF)-like protein
MKVSSVNVDPLAAVRRRLALKAAAPSDAVARTADTAAFLGLSEPELTPAVQSALARLVSEIEELRQEVSRLKAQLNEAEGLADQDVLTPLLNRRAFVRELGRTAAFAQRYGAPAALIYFDLDGFKAVNDRFGHAAGDAALRAVATRLAAQVRESDVVGRLGGDEFAVILAQADEAAAAAKAEVLKTAIEAEPVACGDWMAPMRVTYGVARIEPGASPEDLLAAADRAMYQVKRKRAAEQAAAAAAERAAQGRSA